MRYPVSHPRRISRVSSRTVAVTAAVAVLSLLATTPSVLWAQETGGQGAADAPPPSTVVKGKAPLPKEVLRVKLPRPQEFALPNGARLFVLEDHRLPTVAMSVQVRAGTLFEEKSGVADMTASLLTEGTTTRSARKLAEDAEKIGASLSARAGSERATVGVSGLSENTDTLVELLADVLLRPSFPQDRLTRTQFRAAAATVQRRSDPAFLAGELSRKLFYGAETPYGRPSPTAEQIRALTVADLRAYHDRYYRPGGALIGVVGDVKPREIADKLKAALADWKPAAGGSATVELPSASGALPKEKSAIYVIDRPGSAQTVLSFGNIAPVRRSDPDYIALQVTNRILGGNFSSRLNQKLREEKGYTYGARSTLVAPKWPGTWGASTNVRTAVTVPAVKDTLAEFARIQREPVRPQELEQAKRSMIGSFALTLESPSAVLERTLDLVDFGLPLDYWDTYPSRVEAVTAADIQRVAKKYLGEGRIQLVAVGERSEIETGLAGIAPVTVFDPADLENATKPIPQAAP